jgi:hypothetical protein
MRGRVLALALTLLASAAPSLAQPGDMPREGTLPPGHPPIDGLTPPAGGSEGAPTDDPSVPAGSILVQAKGLGPELLATLEASLVEWHQAKDEATRTVRAKTRIDAAGSAQFTGLAASMEVSYGVVVEHEGVSHASPSFRLSARAGKRVPVQVFPVTTNMDEALVGVRAILYLEPRDQHVYVEQLFQFSNLSGHTWRAHPMPVRLPAGALTFVEAEQPGPLEVTPVQGSGVMIKGLVPPGTTDVTFQYQLPYPSSDTLRLDVGMPPRVGSVRVMAGLGPGLTLHVAGLGPPSATRNEQGQRLLLVEHEVPAGADQIEKLSLAVSGLPTGLLARRLGIGLTFLLMVGGIAAAVLGRRRVSDEPSSQPPTREREVLLDDVRSLEERLAGGKVSRSEYESERNALLDRLAETFRETSGPDLDKSPDPGESGGDKE